MKISNAHATRFDRGIPDIADHHLQKEPVAIACPVTSNSNYRGSALTCRV